RKPSWITLLRLRALPFWSNMGSKFRHANDPAGTHAYAAVGDCGFIDPDGRRSAARVLADVFALALEVFRRGHRRLADCAASYRVGFLRSGRHRSAQPVRTVVSSSHRP